MKRYFYGISGNQIYNTHRKDQILEPCPSEWIRLVSEIGLPGFSEKHWGKCSARSKDISTDTPIGTIMDTAFGDHPKIMKKCKLISFDINEIPKRVRELLYDCSDTITLEYKGKKIWAERKVLCLEEDLI